MFTKKEAAWIIIAIIIFEFIILFPLEKFNILLFLISPLIILINIISKKIASGFFNIKIEHKIWEVQRWGYYKRSYFKKPVPFGLFLPFFLSLFSLGAIKIPLLLQFDSKNIFEKRILKQRGLKRKSEINDSDMGFTAAWGFISLLIVALIAAFIKFPELARYSIFYGLWNLIPFGKLDGSRLFFGSALVWFLLLIFYIISLILIILL